MAKVILGKYTGIKIPSQLEEREKEEYIVKTLIDCSYVKISQKSIHDRAAAMIEDYAVRLNQQGLSINQYYEAAHTDEVSLVSMMEKNAKKQLEGRAILEAIAEKEGIIVTEKDYDREIEKLSLRYPVNKSEIRMLMRGAEEERLRRDIMVKKAMEFVVEQAVEAR